MNYISRLILFAIIIQSGSCTHMTKDDSVLIKYNKSDRNTEFEKQVQSAIGNIGVFSKQNGLYSEKLPEFVNEAILYGTKEAFDDFMKSQPDWPKNTDVPKSFVGVGESKKFHVVSWKVYKNIFPEATIDDYQRLITHELTHLFHISYLKGKEDNMGPIWFYEGFACLVAHQFSDEPLPTNEKIREILRSPERGNYKLYSSILHELLHTMTVKDLLDHAHDPDFSKKAEGHLLK